MQRSQWFFIVTIVLVLVGATVLHIDAERRRAADHIAHVDAVCVRIGKQVAPLPAPRTVRQLRMRIDIELRLIRDAQRQFDALAAPERNSGGHRIFIDRWRSLGSSMENAYEFFGHGLIVGEDSYLYGTYYNGSNGWEKFAEYVGADVDALDASAKDYGVARCAEIPWLG